MDNLLALEEPESTADGLESAPREALLHELVGQVIVDWGVGALAQRTTLAFGAAVIAHDVPTHAAHHGHSHDLKPRQ